MAEKKSIHEFQTGTPQATTAFLVDTPNTSAESGYVTEKVITSDLGNTLLGTLNYTQSLNTESKNIFGAVNELNENSVNFEEEAIPDIPTRELPYYPSGEYSDLNTTDKHIVGAINEVNSRKADLSLLSDIKRIETEVTGQTCGANACIVVHYTIAVPEGYKVIGGYDSSYYANVIATPISLRDDGNMYFNYFSTSAFSNRTLKATIILAKNINR